MTQLLFSKLQRKAKTKDLNIFKVKIHFHKAMPLDQFSAHVSVTLWADLTFKSNCYALTIGQARRDEGFGWCE